jgi:hypothetical protein
VRCAVLRPGTAVTAEPAWPSSSACLRPRSPSGPGNCPSRERLCSPWRSSLVPGLPAAACCAFGVVAGRAARPPGHGRRWDAAAQPRPARREQARPRPAPGPRPARPSRPGLGLGPPGLRAGHRTVPLLARRGQLLLAPARSPPPARRQPPPPAPRPRLSLRRRGTRLPRISLGPLVTPPEREPRPTRISRVGRTATLPGQHLTPPQLGQRQMRLPAHRVRQPAAPLLCRPRLPPPRLILTARTGASEDYLTGLNHRQAPFCSPRQPNRTAPGGRKPGASQGAAARSSPPCRPQPCRRSVRDRTGAIPHQCPGVGGVAGRQRVAQCPLFPQRGDHGGVPVLLVE